MRMKNKTTFPTMCLLISFLKTSEMIKPSPLLPWNLFCKCSPEKSTGAKFIKLPNKSQAPQQGKESAKLPVPHGCRGTREEHGRAGRSRARHEEIPAGSWGVLCASPETWDYRGMTRRQGCESARKGSCMRMREAVVAAGQQCPVPERGDWGLHLRKSGDMED